MKRAAILSGWKLPMILIVLVIVVGGVVVLARCDAGKPLVISIPEQPATIGEVYVGGAVAAPGWYPLRAGDTIGALLASAGGLNESGGLAEISLVFGGQEAPQKININTADAWLLAALPGIGEGRATAIVADRQVNGLFRDIDELTRVDGIGDGLLSDIRHLITVGE